jgi:hypothetical protein
MHTCLANIYTPNFKFGKGIFPNFENSKRENKPDFGKEPG